MEQGTKLGFVLNQPQDARSTRPLIVLMGWTGCQQKYLKKYSEFLGAMGYPSLQTIMPPSIGFSVVVKRREKWAQAILDYIAESALCPPRQLVFYTFSNGGAWSAWHCVQLMRSDIKYHHFAPLLAGFIFDSAPAYPYLHVAMRAASENIDGQVSKVAVSAWTGLQTVISTVVNFNPSARFWQFMESLDMAVQLYLYSVDDPLCDSRKLDVLLQHKLQQGHAVTAKRWEVSEHVAHLRIHRQEYIESVLSFLQRLQAETTLFGFDRGPDKMVSDQLALIAQLEVDQRSKTDQYHAVLKEITANGDVNSCKAFVDHLLLDAVTLTISRQLLQTLAEGLHTLPAEKHKAIATYVLGTIQPRAVSYEEQVTLIREHLADLYEREEEWSQAATTLAGIDLDSGMRVLDNEFKLEKYIKVAMLYLEDDDAVSAETHLKKASSLISTSKNEALELKYKTCYARVLDSKRKFLEAAPRYYELSQMGKREIDGKKLVEEEDLITALISAVTCTILAQAGPRRSRMLSTLYKDERSAVLPVFPFLEKVYLERVLRPAEVASFAQTLRPHQLALLPDGSTVLDRAVMEHNVAALSRLYNNMYMEQLGALLGVDAVRAEQVASMMIGDNRLAATIDQVDKLIFFKSAAEPLLQWDKHIGNVCSKVNSMLPES